MRDLRRVGLSSQCGAPIAGGSAAAAGGVAAACSNLNDADPPGEVSMFKFDIDLGDVPLELSIGGPFGARIRM